MDGAIETDAHDAQEIAEIFDEEARGEDDGPQVHGELMGPDEGGDDDVAELVGSLEDAEGPIPPEELAMHLTD